jgi:hypothetical protein
MVPGVSEPERVEAPGAALGIWREAPNFEGRPTAALGAFRCDTSETGAALLRTVAEGLFEEGFQAVVGPMDGDTWGAHRLIVESDERAPFFLEPQTPGHHPAAFEAAGFTVIARYFSAEADLDGGLARLTRPTGLSLRPFDLSDPERELRRLHALSLAAFAGNFLFRPIGADAFLELYRPVLPALDPDLVLMAEDEGGALQGFVFGLPDLAQGGQPDAVVLKTYASLRPGGGSLLADAFNANAKRKGFSRVIHALMHESNISARHSRNLGGRVFRRYALWARRP